MHRTFHFEIHTYVARLIFRGCGPLFAITTQPSARFANSLILRSRNKFASLFRTDRSATFLSFVVRKFRSIVTALNTQLVPCKTRREKNGRLDKASWPKRERRLSALSKESWRYERRRRGKKCGCLRSGPVTSHAKRKKHRQRQQQQPAHFCLFRETAPLTKWSDKRNRTRRDRAQYTQSTGPGTVCIARTIDYLSYRRPREREKVS